ncbi:MAG: 2-phosphosulfolactate phosphatase [Acidobacteria bacterium]|nr:2-phosphosulfolactate phosphatase [Acidobacteriota bacterium]
MRGRRCLFEQAAYNICCEWGAQGASLLALSCEVVIVVDVLSFSTSVEVATSQGAAVYPYRWKDGTAARFADSVSAIVADGTDERGYRLSPASLQSLPPQTRLVLPSPNGAEISLATGHTLTLAGCLRNRRAVAEYAMGLGERIAVIPAGERWPDGSLRPCFEDLIGAGSIIECLRGSRSPEAESARAGFANARDALLELLGNCSSGQEKISRDEAGDLVLAASLDVSDGVPLLRDGAYRRVT